MGDTTTISWTDATWNPVTGCTKVSPGCDHCYAEGITERFGGDFSKVMLHPERLEQPLDWKKPRMIFVCSMSDLFHRRVPSKYIRQVFAMMKATPQHTYQVLTKRPGRMAHFAAIELDGIWPPNVWAGTSVESAKYLPRLAPLAKVPAPVRFVSAEPLLGPLDDFGDWLDTWICKGKCGGDLHCPGCEPLIGWTIIGGESGAGARPMEAEWAKSIVAQCRAARAPVFVKQMGTAWARAHGALDQKAEMMDTWPEDLRVREWPNAAHPEGKHDAS